MNPPSALAVTVTYLLLLSQITLPSSFFRFLRKCTVNHANPTNIPRVPSQKHRANAGDILFSAIFIGRPHRCAEKIARVYIYDIRAAFTT